MRFPKMRVSSPATVTVPKLNGGVNLWDMPEQVGDNQLTACNNVWWHNGALQTRPGLTGTGDVGSLFPICQRISDEETMLMCYRGEDDEYQEFWAALVTADGTVEHLGSEENCCLVPCRTDHRHSAFCCRAPKNKDYDWLFFLADSGPVAWSSLKQAWVDVEEDVCVPWVLINGHGTDAPGDGKSATLEAFNKLTNIGRCTYTTDGVSKTYYLPVKGQDTVSLYSARLTVKNDNTIRTIEASIDSTYNMGLFRDLTPAEAGVSSTAYKTVDIRIWLDAVSGALTFTAHGDGNDGSPIPDFVLPTAYTEAANNLEVGIYVSHFTERDDTICRMTRTLWFGGAKNGLGNGAHLFVTGNPDKPNLLHWSDVNEPLYFPENNYAYIGDDGAPITALAKQGELLVIFRENDIYCAQYVAGEIPTAEELESGAVIETTVHKAYFPITQLHPNIGCDCPDTIRLVNNKLVWLTGDGRVHILTGANQYSERNVRQASPLIERALRAHTKEELQEAVAGEYEGYYVLLIGNKLYLMDCQTSAFTSFQYYSREETAQKALPWYVWTLPRRRYTGMVYDGDGLLLVADGEERSELYAFGGDTDDGAPVESSFTTKLFRFSRADAKKSIGPVYLSVEDAAGCRVAVHYVTERGVQEDGYPLECDGERHGALRQYRLTPHVRLAEAFGLRLEARQPMTVAGMTINYKNQGVVR